MKRQHENCVAGHYWFGQANLQYLSKVQWFLNLQNFQWYSVCVNHLAHMSSHFPRPVTIFSQPIWNGLFMGLTDFFIESWNKWLVPLCLASELTYTWKAPECTKPNEFKTNPCAKQKPEIYWTTFTIYPIYLHHIYTYTWQLCRG